MPSASQPLRALVLLSLQALAAAAGADNPDKEKTVCTPEFKVHDKTIKFCLHTAWNEKSSCQAEIDLSLQLNANSSYLFTKQVDPQTLELCTSRGASGLDAEECGDAPQVCVNFDKGSSNITIGPGFAAGCPQLEIKNCVPKGKDKPIEIKPQYFDCFALGHHCYLHTDCDACLENGCGWCAAGYKKEYSCLMKNHSGTGAMCPTACESTCDCHWHTAVCPVDEEYIKNLDVKMQKLINTISSVTNNTIHLNDEVAKDSEFELNSKKYKCLDKKQISHIHSTRTAVTVTVVLLTAIIGLCVGVFIGKLGYLDLLFGDGEDGGLANLYTRSE